MNDPWYNITRILAVTESVRQQVKCCKDMNYCRDRDIFPARRARGCHDRNIVMTRECTGRFTHSVAVDLITHLVWCSWAAGRNGHCREWTECTMWTCWKSHRSALTVLNSTAAEHCWLASQEMMVEISLASRRKCRARRFAAVDWCICWLSHNQSVDQNNRYFRRWRIWWTQHAHARASVICSLDIIISILGKKTYRRRYDCATKSFCCTIVPS